MHVPEIRSRCRNHPGKRSGALLSRAGGRLLFRRWQPFEFEGARCRRLRRGYVARSRRLKTIASCRFIRRLCFRRLGPRGRTSPDLETKIGRDARIGSLLQFQFCRFDVDDRIGAAQEGFVGARRAHIRQPPPRHTGRECNPHNSNAKRHKHTPKPAPGVSHYRTGV